MSSHIEYDVVIPTIGRPSLTALLASIASSRGPKPEQIILVDDRVDASSELSFKAAIGELAERVVVVRSTARGPAAARNRGSRQARASWLVFLDDDVVVHREWCASLNNDLLFCVPPCVGISAIVRVPLPADRKPTDWERNVCKLETAAWITADFAYRRDVFRASGGFDERFPRAFREDADLALRLQMAGYVLAKGSRIVFHSVRSVDRWISVRLQAGNADDALMHRKFGKAWSALVPQERLEFRRHVWRVVSGLAAAAATATWLAMTAAFAWRRIAPGPRDRPEIVTLVVTSIAIPFAAIYHRMRGKLALTLGRFKRHTLPAIVLFDRDGTIVRDDPALCDPDAVRLMPDAAAAIERLRGEGIAIGVVSNQHRVGEGDLSPHDLARVNARIDRLLGAMDLWVICMHARDAACECRKPKPGLVLEAVRRSGAPSGACVVIGDIGSDIEAARGAGARSILVPTDVTLAHEIARAPIVARDLMHAVDLILRGAA